VKSSIVKSGTANSDPQHDLVDLAKGAEVTAILL
jgi:hypothetical protein